MECPVRPECCFFAKRMALMPASAEIMIKRFCEDDYERCARYRVHQVLSSHGVPDDLYPRDTMRAKLLIDQSR